MGYPDGAKPMDDVQGRSVTGGSFPAEIWGRFMSAAMESREAQAFPDPPSEMLERSRPSGGGGSDADEGSDDTTTSTSSTTSTTVEGGDDEGAATDGTDEGGTDEGTTNTRRTSSGG